MSRIFESSRLLLRQTGQLRGKTFFWLLDLKTNCFWSLRSLHAGFLFIFTCCVIVYHLFDLVACIYFDLMLQTGEINEVNTDHRDFRFEWGKFVAAEK